MRTLASFSLPLAADVATIQAQKNTLVNSAGADEPTRETLFAVLQAILTEIENVLAEKTNLSNSVVINVDRSILAKTQFPSIRAYLSSRGFVSIPNPANDTLTVSW